MSKEIPCIRAPKNAGEETIALANQLGVLDKSLLIQRFEDSICIPLLRELQGNELKRLITLVPASRLENGVFAEKQRSAGTLMQALEGKLPPHMLASLPRALDVVGDIAIVEIPSELKTHEDLVGKAILEVHQNVKTVLAKAGSISGTYRLREFKFVAGEKRTQTVHREFGCQFHVDVVKAYFSPRLSHEHVRVASLVQAGETVVDLFAGVGPFSVLIGKRNPDVYVYAVDVNPEAIELLKVNVRANRVENRVFPVLGDAREVTRTKLKASADRVIMNLPETAIEFVDVACEALKPQGGIIHFYTFVRSPDSMENQKNRFSEAVEKSGRRMKKILCLKSVRETAPYEFQVVLDSEIV